MPTVDFIYDEGCPNVKAARANLMRAFSRAGMTARWSEHQIGSAEAPAHARGFGSPTILVDRVDVAGLDAGAEECCRLYGSERIPSATLIADALRRAQNNEAQSNEVEQAAASPPANRWKSTVAVLPGVGIALMPKVVCPLCWPAYAGVLSAAGLTFLMEDRWLLPISAALLLAALAALAWRAQTRRGYGPFALGVASAVAILMGKFAAGSSTLAYIGIAALLVACVWNAWPRRKLKAECSACIPSATE